MAVLVARRHAPVPVGHELVLVRDAEQPGLAEVRADELQSGRQLAIALADEAARDRHRRSPARFAPIV
jgi:hypothetical protein